MYGILNVQVDRSTLKRFEIALNLSSKDKTEIVEGFMNSYISSVFSKISKEHGSVYEKEEAHLKGQGSFFGKAKRKIPRWAANPHQFNHRIVRAFFQIEETLGVVPYSALEKRCTNNEAHPDINVPTFKSNFDQMTRDDYHSHGKVFEVADDKVVLWDYTKQTLLEYKKDFIR